MEFNLDGSMLSAIIAGVTAMVTTGIAFGKVTQRVNRMTTQFDRIEAELMDHMKEDIDRLARIETQLEGISRIEEILRQRHT